MRLLRFVSVILDGSNNLADDIKFHNSLDGARKYVERYKADMEEYAGNAAIYQLVDEMTHD